MLWLVYKTCLKAVLINGGYFIVAKFLIMKYFPVYRLNEVISKTFEKTISLDIAQGIRDGLDSMIHFVDEQGGPLSTIAEIIDKPILIDKDEPKRYVKISAAYSQMLWLICSIVMRNHDSVAINYEIEQMSIEEHKSFLRELEIDNTITKYIRALLDQKVVFSESADILNKIEILSNRKLSDEEMEQLYTYDMTSDIGVRVNSLYVYAMSFILLHEFSHHSLNHDFNHYGTTEEEEVADHNAFWTLYSDLKGNERTTALLGILCALVSLIFVNPSLEDDGIHPLPIERVFYFYDIVKEESTKFAGLMCHLFYTWAVYVHDANMPQLDGSYDETFDKIKAYMIEKEHQANNRGA